MCLRRGSTAAQCFITAEHFYQTNKQEHLLCDVTLQCTNQTARAGGATRRCLGLPTASPSAGRTSASRAWTLTLKHPACRWSRTHTRFCSVDPFVSVHSFCSHLVSKHTLMWNIYLDSSRTFWFPSDVNLCLASNQQNLLVKHDF